MVRLRFFLFLQAGFFFLFPTFFWGADDRLEENMAKNKKVEIGGVEFEVFRTLSRGASTAAFPYENYLVSVGSDGLLYDRRTLWGSTPEKPLYEAIPSSSHSLPNAAKFIVDTSGRMYVFQSTNDTDLQRDRAFLFSQPEIIAAGDIILHEGKVLAMAPLLAQGLSDEKALIGFARLLRAQGYEEHPIVISDTGESFKMVREFYRKHSLEKDFYENFLRTFSKHLENVDYHLAPRHSDCKSGLLGVPKSRLFRI